MKEENQGNNRQPSSSPKTIKHSNSRSNELSLFSNELLSKTDDISKNENLKEDLIELKLFLQNLLKEM